MHIYDFITDDEQYKLKKANRYGTDQPFEQSLIAYRDYFLEQLKQCTSHENSNYLNDDLNKNPGLGIWFQEFNDLVQKNAAQIESLINDLLTVYNVFIGGQHQTAVSLLSFYLEKYDLLDSSYHELLGCHLRGRWIQTGDDIMKERYYFHIPTNKRHLIRNQRFSFSGIPILYVGESLSTVFYELEAKDLEDKRIAIASFNYNQFASLRFNSDWENFKSRNKVYNITNTIYEVINDIFFKIIEKGAEIATISSSIALPPKVILRFFRKFILSQLCTFPKKIIVKDQHFIEEYVFPQLLTEAIKNHKYDGIVYPSTKFFDKSLDFGKGWHSKIFQANIAMFTHYNPYSVYDDELFKNFDPHVLPLKNVKANNAYELLGNLLKDAATLQAFFNKYVSPSEISSNFETLLIHLEKKIKTYQVLKIDGENYLDTYAGKVEAEYMKEYLKYVRIQAKKFYQNEYEKWEEDEGKKSLGI